MKLTREKTIVFEYKGQMINYIKKIDQNELVEYCGSLNAKTGKYVLTYRIYKREEKR